MIELLLKYGASIHATTEVRLPARDKVKLGVSQTKKADFTPELQRCYTPCLFLLAVTVACLFAKRSTELHATVHATILERSAAAPVRAG